ncbi:hypothetical protein B0H34DRAFT_679593 [Crassisporium funariophilum]|nr:hypothetical protein B0H34DRAFT_679593 [Crassisporium funariophilum]
MVVWLRCCVVVLSRGKGSVRGEKEKRATWVHLVDLPPPWVFPLALQSPDPVVVAGAPGNRERMWSWQTRRMKNAGGGERIEMEEGMEKRWNVGEQIQLESAFPPSIPKQQDMCKTLPPSPPQSSVAAHVHWPLAMTTAHIKAHPAAHHKHGTYRGPVPHHDKDHGTLLAQCSILDAGNQQQYSAQHKQQSTISLVKLHCVEREASVKQLPLGQALAAV